MKRVYLFILLFLISCGGGLNETKQVSLETGNLILGHDHGGNGAAWGLPDCISCHPLSVIHERADNTKAMVEAKGYETCMGCHGANGTGEARQCRICHNMEDLPGRPYQSGRYSHLFLSGAGGKLSDSECITCHEASDMNGTFDPNKDLTRFPDTYGKYSSYDSKADFCLRCHNRDHQQKDFEITERAFDDPLVAMEDNYTYIDKHGKVKGTGLGPYKGLRRDYSYGTVVECSDCHAVHGTDNNGLIIDSSVSGVSLLDPGVRNRPYSVEIVDGDFSQLCVLCHKMEVVLDSGGIETGNGLSGVHRVGTDCRSCHTHGETVQAGL